MEWGISGSLGPLFPVRGPKNHDVAAPAKVKISALTGRLVDICFLSILNSGRDKSL